MQEWTPAKRWNPFNSYKLLAQVYRWRLIKRGHPLPQPALVTVDPLNACNLRCAWCNAARILEDRSGFIQKETLLELAAFLAEWQGNPGWPAGVEGVCIAGGGEPLLHRDIGEFIEACMKNGIEVGVVTNGTRIRDHLEALSLCTWVGVSIDAGQADTFAKLKGKDYFHSVLDNIASLRDFIEKKPCKLATNIPGYGISYKFLLHNGNITDILPAAQKAKELGCKNFHLRPAGVRWDQVGSAKERIFEPGVREELSRQIELARELEDENFGVYGITHKFDAELNRANQFDTCHAVFMTAVFMPPREPDQETFCFGLCCDRRGDRRLEAGIRMTRARQVADFWGSEDHWAIHDQIDVHSCPRCTYQPHNQIFEHVILQDSMTYKFI